jgi:alpha-tubulin suppressor-like RCC1 family protein
MPLAMLAAATVALLLLVQVPTAFPVEAGAASTLGAWGQNDFGQLGNGTTTNSAIPVQVSGLTNMVAAAGGALHSLAVKGDGTV